jgi:hypothetical protein
MIPNAKINVATSANLLQNNGFKVEQSQYILLLGEHVQSMVW